MLLVLGPHVLSYNIKMMGFQHCCTIDSPENIFKSQILPPDSIKLGGGLGVDVLKFPVTNVILEVINLCEGFSGRVSKLCPGVRPAI